MHAHRWISGVCIPPISRAICQEREPIQTHSEYKSFSRSYDSIPNQSSMFPPLLLFTLVIVCLLCYFSSVALSVSSHHDCSRTQPLGIKSLVTTPKKSFRSKAGGSSDGITEESPEPSVKKGSIVGAVSLIIGTSIGSGIPAHPEKTSSAGFIPSVAAMILCWLFLAIEAILLAEIKVHLQRKMKKVEKEGDELEVISLRIMAQEMLGEWGGGIATITYLFLAYTSIVAHTSKSGEVLSHMINLPDYTSGILFTFLISILILTGGTHITDQVNQWLTIFMIGLLVAIEVIAFSSSDWSNSIILSNWFKVPSTIPVIIFSLVYHDIAPVICAYLGCDLICIRLTIVIGSIVPLLTLLVWDEIALSSTPSQDGVDFLEFLVRGKPGIVLPMTSAFSLLVVGTSLIGTLLGFSEFFKEQIDKWLIHSHSIQTHCSGKSKEDWANSYEWNKILYNAMGWWRNNKRRFLAISIATIPSMLISIMLPDAFSVATDIAGGYCMTILYGALPPAMAWMMRLRLLEDDNFHKDEDRKANEGQATLSNIKPILIGAGLFSWVIVMEQILQNLSILKSE